ncbi:MFS transporter [Candidatus Woesearchaeota archaeon]|nr:MFS transporter [Candidatus Woesearchaeota archaeon]
MPYNLLLHKLSLTKIKKELKEIYAATIMRAFSLSLVSVFIPMYLLNLGYELNQALFYLAIFYLTMAIFAPIVSVISSKAGLKHTIAIGPGLTIVYLLLLRSIGEINLPLYPIAIVGAIGAIIYWVPMNSHFTKSSNKGRRGTETGLFTALPKVAAVTAPFIGGVMIASFGFSLLFLIAAVLLLVSVAPLFLSYEYKSHMKYKWKQIFSKKNLHWFDDFFVQGFVMVPVFVMFPIYIFTLSQNFSITGAAVSLMSLGIAICAILLGRATDKFGKKAIMRASAIILSLVFIGLIFITNPFAIYGMSFFIGVGWTGIAIPMFTFFCDNLKPGTRTEFMSFRDLSYCSGRTIALFFLILVPLLLKFKIAFAIAAIAAIYFAMARL